MQERGFAGLSRTRDQNSRELRKALMKGVAEFSWDIHMLTKPKYRFSLVNIVFCCPCQYDLTVSVRVNLIVKWF